MWFSRDHQQNSNNAEHQQEHDDTGEGRFVRITIGRENVENNDKHVHYTDSLDHKKTCKLKALLTPLSDHTLLWYINLIIKNTEFIITKSRLTLAYTYLKSIKVLKITTFWIKC